LGEEQEAAFQTLKKKLSTAPVLAHFNEHAELEIHSDASSRGIAAILHQRDANGLQVVAYASRTYSPAETRYIVSEQEMLAVVWSISKFREFIFAKPIKIIVDHHALCSLQMCRNPRNARLARWALKLQDIDYTIEHISGKRHVPADCLSRMPIKIQEKDENADDLEIPVYNIVAVSPRNQLASLSSSQWEDPKLKAIMERLQTRKLTRKLRRFSVAKGVLHCRCPRTDAFTYYSPKVNSRMSAAVS